MIAFLSIWCLVFYVFREYTRYSLEPVAYSPPNGIPTQSKQYHTARMVKDGLVIYTPSYRNIDLVCGTMPSMADTNVIFCSAAAFTGKCLSFFTHRNIAGNHVSGGRLEQGYLCHRNTGAFVYYDGKYSLYIQITAMN